jgi:hypothetical protein
MTLSGKVIMRNGDDRHVICVPAAATAVERFYQTGKTVIVRKQLGTSFVRTGEQHGADLWNLRWVYNIELYCMRDGFQHLLLYVLSR